nr:sugar transferase [bacterium]
MRKKTPFFPNMISFLLKLLLLGGLCVAFVFVLFFFYGNRIPFHRNGYYLIIALYAVALYGLMHIYHCFKFDRVSGRELLLSTFLACVIVNAAIYLVISLVCLGFINAWYMLGLMGVQLVYAALIIFIMRNIYPHLFPTRRLLIICGKDGPQSRQLAMMYARRKSHYRRVDRVVVQPGMGDIGQLLESYDQFLLCEVEEPILSTVLDFAYLNNRSIYIQPTLSQFLLSSAHHTQFQDILLLHQPSQVMTPEQRFLKRTMDIVISGLGLVILSPIMLLVALAIKLSDHGPVFFKQDRCTLDGRIFSIYKFRSMRVDAEKDGAKLATQGDDRITPVGRFIRRVRLDEIPQLINIFKGEMSIVGPRPERIENVEAYQAQLPEFSYRLKVKAGLTGLAQVQGRYNTSPRDKLMFDLQYIQNFSIWLDLRILLQTIKTLFTPESTQGFDEGQTASTVAAAGVSAPPANTHQPEGSPAHSTQEGGETTP